jgi:Predicted oxidoreductases (related to aryl-alcohol dehydrogenases)
MVYVANDKRYDSMLYNRVGKSGLKLPAVSLGLWHNFGSVDKYDNMVKMAAAAFDLGITHFDLANNYGPEPGSAEENFGKILSREFKPYRDELIISSKAGYTMWPGPYGDWGSKKYLMASLDQSLVRMGLDYVDIFYSHRPDPETPLEETMEALAQAARLGKALYVGVSNYDADGTRKAAAILRSLGVRCLIHQPKFSMFERWIENGLVQALEEEGMGTIAFSPLAEGLLTDKYIKGIPDGSRASRPEAHLKRDQVTPEKIAKIVKLNELAAKRGQSLAQFALVWALKVGKLTSVLIGASRTEQVRDNVAALNNREISADELKTVNDILAGA